MSKNLKSMKQQEEEKEEQERARELKKIEKDIEKELIKQQLFYELYELMEENGENFNLYNLDLKSEIINKIVKSHKWLNPNAFYIYFLHKNYNKTAREVVKYYESAHPQKKYFTFEEFQEIENATREEFKGCKLKRKKAGILSHFLIALLFK